MRNRIGPYIIVEFIALKRFELDVDGLKMQIIFKYASVFVNNLNHQIKKFKVHVLIGYFVLIFSLFMDLDFLMFD